MIFTDYSVRFSRFVKLPAIVVSILIPIFSFSQSITPEKVLTDIKTNSDRGNKDFPAEKLYLQFDKPYYAPGDTIWFKAYLFNAPTLLFSAKSGLLHIDITTDSGKMVKQYLIPVTNGIGWGNITIDTSLFKQGNYTLHAYTNWMRNFGGDIFYTKHFYIAGPGGDSWLINAKTSIADTIDKVQINNQLQFTDINKKPLANKEFQLGVYAGKKNWYKQLVTTNHLGLLDANFSLPQKSTNVFIIAALMGDGKKAIIPIQLNRPENIDLQFMPEGGTLIGGLPATVGFKAIGENGKGTDISGIIVDHKKKQVAAFQSVHNGMGSFNIEVKNGESYLAEVTLPGGVIKEYPLPAVKSSGTILNVKNLAAQDSVTVSIAATDDVIQSGGSYFLLAKSRGVVCYAATFNFSKGQIRKAIAKKLFPSGIAHFIVAAGNAQPLNERLVFIDHKDNLDIKVAEQNIVYASRDSIALHLAVTDNSGTPASGNFSMTVTDDALVKQDTLNDDNILTHLLLTCDLKGYVETPGYYFQSDGNKSWLALDNLLLTQGWVNYDWPAEQTHPLFKLETEFTVAGQVVNVFKSPVKGTRVQLLSKSPLLASDTVTDKEGHFVFNNFPRIDTPAFELRAVNKSGKSFNVDIKMDEPPALSFKSPFPASTPCYINSDPAMLNFTKAKDSVAKLQDNFLGSGHRLREVKITAQKIVKGSQNLNGPGNADLVLDEKDMIKAGKKTWLDILQAQVKGFHVGTIKNYITRFYIQHKLFGELGIDGGIEMINSYPSRFFPWFFIDDKPIKFIVDGIPFGENIKIPDWGNPSISDIENYLKLRNAEDIKGIEVNSSSKYNSLYFVRYMPVDWPLFVKGQPFKVALSAVDFTFIEITTRSGRGPFTPESTPGTYLYKPIALSWPKQFYKPRYEVSDTTNHIPTLRSTIDWEPNIVTDKNGRATVSFFAADKPSTYTVIIEGTDGNGNLGYKTEKIIIGKPKS